MESGLMSQKGYVVDDPTAHYHPPVNKGHESMVYLTYIIDHYDDLPDVSIFVHAHRYAWHNNAMQGDDMSQMLRYLSPERVTREGYMNLRCEWEPGCPSWLHPGALARNTDKQEEWLIAEAWISLFPLDPIPTVLAQPCCAQFAVSKSRIRALDRTRYIALREWLMATDLSDTIAGRIFEYIWQYIFTAAPVQCPSMNVCYCDGYGMCFDGGAKTLDRAAALHTDVRELEQELEAWDVQADHIAKLREQSRNGQVPEEADVRVPEPGRGTYLRTRVQQMHEELQRLQDEARERGRDPKQRALQAGREWKEGDGF
nr:hypothetical protein CFP56_09062 [Quercus suber]